MTDLEAAGRDLLSKLAGHLRKALDLTETLERRQDENEQIADELKRRVGDTGKLMAELRDETAAIAQLARTGLQWATGQNNWDEETKPDA